MFFTLISKKAKKHPPKCFLRHSKEKKYRKVNISKDVQNNTPQNMYISNFQCNLFV